ncbi:hypothetical protein LOTGIDRAFT_152359 [Lottia gigantea]|uniref:Uncharacterized protein n=1 Tax=Lottia gigantea TaxID=225164 RepID=V4CSJ2_LOTGI|nr:hypothetical protein LOTGIDRAFT_152359 [Lottia gigantea]ESP05505.1 hypothetical protein LOTGIDRAFT_152359 [Lottia gigantea]
MTSKNMCISIRFRLKTFISVFIVLVFISCWIMTGQSRWFKISLVEVFSDSKYKLSNGKDSYKIGKWVAKGILDKKMFDVLTMISSGTSQIYINENMVVKTAVNKYSNGQEYRGTSSYFSAKDYNIGNNWIPTSLEASNVSIFTNFVNDGRTAVDERAPPITLPNGVMSYFTVNNTIFLRPAFWSLVLLTDISESCQKWLCFVHQRLLWEIDEHIGLSSNNKSSISSILPHMKRWIQKMNKWECPPILSFFECVFLIHKQYPEPCGKLTHQIIKDWLYDLSSVGYQEPRRQTRRNYTKPNVYFTPRLNNFNQTSTVLFTHKFNSIRKLCKRYPSKFVEYDKKIELKVCDNVVLLIVFNKPFYDNIPKLQLTYSTVFSRIVYCGSNMPAFNKSSKSFSENVTFIAINDIGAGSYNYICMAKVMEINFKVDGYLFIGDDTLLNTRQLDAYPLNKPMIVGLDPFRRSWKSHKWPNWNKNWGRSAFLSAWKELEDIANKSLEFSQRFTYFTNNLYNNSGFNDGLQTSAVDFFYIPSKYQNDFIFYFNLFFKHKVYLEIAVATIISGVIPKSDIILSRGKYLWSVKDRQNYEQFYNNELLYLHPVKFNREFKSDKGLKFFCEIYFPYQFYG